MVENAGDFSTGESRHRISALVSGSPKLQLLDPTVSSGLLGCWGLGGCQDSEYYSSTLEISGPTIGY